MVDWSIFWNDIFPGLILIISSSFGAYIVVHRYQRIKQEKEIRDDLTRQEHEILNKHWSWMRLTLENLATKSLTKEEIKRTMQESDKSFEKLERILKRENEEAEKSEEEKSVSFDKLKDEILEIVKEDRSRLFELKERIVKEEELLKNYQLCTDEIVLSSDLLYKRLINQLGINYKKLAFFKDFIIEMRDVAEKTQNARRTKISDLEIEQIRKQTIDISQFFVNVEDLILQRKSLVEDIRHFMKKFVSKKTKKK